MAPNISSKNEVNILQDDDERKMEKLIAPQAEQRKFEIIYENLFIYGYWYFGGLYGLYLCFTSAKWLAILLAMATYVAAQIGITAGVHRLWSHKAYKAKLPLQIILMIFNTLAFQKTAVSWARDHRLHHKLTDTDADPHNATRGLFFSHIGWLLVRKHPEVKKKGKLVDLTDLYNNPVLRFQKKYSVPWFFVVSIVLPILIPMYFWDETLNIAWHINLLRSVLNLNATSMINSFAHAWGYKPYDKNIMATQNLSASIVTFGEGFHNYHHTFPWDYRASELGNSVLNFSSKFIDFFAWIGWAYDLKTVSKDMISGRMLRTGDGSHLRGDNREKTFKENKTNEGNLLNNEE